MEDRQQRTCGILQTLLAKPGFHLQNESLLPLPVEAYPDLADKNAATLQGTDRKSR